MHDDMEVEVVEERVRRWWIGPQIRWTIMATPTQNST
jgi:hypothetical protein